MHDLPLRGLKVCLGLVDRLQERHKEAIHEASSMSCPSPEGRKPASAPPHPTGALRPAWFLPSEPSERAPAAPSLELVSGGGFTAARGR